MGVKKGYYLVIISDNHDINGRLFCCSSKKSVEKFLDSMLNKYHEACVIDYHVFKGQKLGVNVTTEINVNVKEGK